MRVRAIIFSCASLAMLGFVSGRAVAQNTSSDVQITINAVGTSAWEITAVAPSGIEVGTLGADNPTITLELGKRYRVNNAGYQAGFHPFAQLARGLGFATDNPPSLIQGFGNGPLEGNVGIDWHDDNAGNVYFTATGELLSAIRATGKKPGYRCQNHEPMRGDLVFANQPSALGWDSGVDQFEDTPVAMSVDLAVTGWSVVGGSASYTARMADSPAGLPGQPAGSARWLTITDADSTGSNRVYSPGILVPPQDTVGSYAWKWRGDVQSIGAGRVRWVVQHRAGGTFQNVAGIELTSTSVAAIVMGADLGAIGTAGPTQRAPLFAIGDAGGFGLNQWIEYAFELDLNNLNNLTLRAQTKGSDGVTLKTAEIAGFTLANPATDLRDFRFCIRNEGTGNVSSISYDNVELIGEGSINRARRAWEAYE